MEKFSKKRGRPETWVGKDRADAERIFPGKSRRQHNNLAHRACAMAALMGHPEFPWLVASHEEIRAHTGWIQNTVVAALGRLGDADVIRDVARSICEQQLNTRAVLTYIRWMRFGEKSASTEDLAERLRTTINHYLESHAEMSWSEVRTALQLVTGMIPDA